MRLKPLPAARRCRLRFAVEDALLVGGPDVAAGDEFEVVGIVLADEDAAFVAGADQGGLHRLAVQSCW